jgi:hypothetical protein
MEFSPEDGNEEKIMSVFIEKLNSYSLFTLSNSSNTQLEGFFENIS